MKYVITHKQYQILKESPLVHLVSMFLDKIDHPEGVCRVGTKLKNDGDIILDVHIKKEAFIVFGSGLTVGQIRKYYTDKVSSYFGVPVHVYFELVNKCLNL
jgi:hypothetical protein